MLIGAHDAILHEVQRIDIHGTYFYDLFFEHLDPAGPIRRARVASESIYGDPQPGDPIRITYLMGVITNVERRA
jgi:hypothetical protein